MLQRVLCSVTRQVSEHITSPDTAKVYPTKYSDSVWDQQILRLEEKSFNAIKCILENHFLLWASSPAKMKTCLCSIVRQMHICIWIAILPFSGCNLLGQNILTSWGPIFIISKPGTITKFVVKIQEDNLSNDHNIIGHKVEKCWLLPVSPHPPL